MKRRIGRWWAVVLVVLVACAAPPVGPEVSPDFGFALEDSVLAAVPGTVLTTSVVITPIDGFAGGVALALEDRSGGAVDPGLVLDPGAITVAVGDVVGQSVQRQVSLEVGAGVALDRYELRMVATSDDLTSTADLTLTVAASLLPQVAITAPADGSTVTGSRLVTLEGTLSAVDGIANLSVEGVRDVLDVSHDGVSFSIDVELENRTRDVVVIAEDAAGRVGRSAPTALTFPFLTFENFQPASVVIGQPDFTSWSSNQGGGVASNTVNLALGAPLIVGDGTLLIPDTGNNRVLGFHRVPTTNDAGADFVLGQPDFNTSATDFNTSATEFDVPATANSDGTRLALADVANNRVLIWNQIATSAGVPADVVVGQADFVSSGSGCAADAFYFPDAATFAGDRLIVADRTNRRVLIWNSVPTSNGQSADLVLGQASFTTCVANDDDQDGVSDGTPSARTLSFVTDVWSDGERIVVSDYGNHRILIWNSFPTTNFAPADVVLGQPDFVTAAFGTDDRTFFFARQATSNSNQLFVADAGNNRVLIYDDFPTENGQPADRVLGQSSFTNGTDNDNDQDGVMDAFPSSRTLRNPRGVTVLDDRLLVADTFNERVLIYEGR